MRRTFPKPHQDGSQCHAELDCNWPELIRAGVRTFEYEPTMVHVKLMIVDDTFVSIGSGNFDNRSIRLTTKRILMCWTAVLPRNKLVFLKATKSSAGKRHSTKRAD